MVPPPSPLITDLSLSLPLSLSLSPGGSSGGLPSAAPHLRGAPPSPAASRGGLARQRRPSEAEEERFSRRPARALRGREAKEERVSRWSGSPARASSSRRPWAPRPSPAPSNPRAVAMEAAERCSRRVDRRGRRGAEERARPRAPPLRAPSPSPLCSPGGGARRGRGVQSCGGGKAGLRGGPRSTALVCGLRATGRVYDSERRGACRRPDPGARIPTSKCCVFSRPR